MFREHCWKKRNIVWKILCCFSVSMLYVDGLIVLCLTPFSTVFHFYRGGQCTYHAFLVSFKPTLRTIVFPNHCLLSYRTIIETMDSGERGINPVI